MKKEEVMAVTPSMEMQLASEKIEVPSTEGLPGSDYDLDVKRLTPDGRELLPEPPKEIYVNIPDEDCGRALEEALDGFCASTGMTAVDVVLWIEWYDNHLQWEINQADAEDAWYDEWQWYSHARQMGWE